MAVERPAVDRVETGNERSCDFWSGNRKNGTSRNTRNNGRGRSGEERQREKYRFRAVQGRTAYHTRRSSDLSRRSSSATEDGSRNFNPDPTDHSEADCEPTTGDGDFDITESAITNFQEIDITESSITEFDITKMWH